VWTAKKNEQHLAHEMHFRHEISATNISCFATFVFNTQIFSSLALTSLHIYSDALTWGW